MRQESSAVDRLYSDFSLMIEHIDDSEISLRSAAEEIFQKSLYVAIGSYFEQRITTYIVEFMSEVSGGNVLVREFTRVKGVSRQYHCRLYLARVKRELFKASPTNGPLSWGRGLEPAPDLIRG